MVNNKINYGLVNFYYLYIIYFQPHACLFKIGSCVFHKNNLSTLIQIMLTGSLHSLVVLFIK